MCLTHIDLEQDWRIYGTLCTNPERPERHQREVHHGIYKKTGNMLRYRSCSWCACVLSHKSVYRNVGSDLRWVQSLLLRYSADSIRKMEFSWRNRQNICVNTLQDLESGITAQQTYLSALKGISNTQESRKS